MQIREYLPKEKSIVKTLIGLVIFAGTVGYVYRDKISHYIDNVQSRLLFEHVTQPLIDNRSFANSGN